MRWTAEDRCLADGVETDCEVGWLADGKEGRDLSGSSELED